MTVFRGDSPDDRPSLVMLSGIRESTPERRAKTPVYLQVGLLSCLVWGSV